MDQDQVGVVEAYSRLKSIKEHVPGPHIDPRYVAEFHQILDLLEQASGANLMNFRIPASEVHPVITSVRRGGGWANYSRKPYCERAFFEMKVDGVLTMFQLLLNSRRRGKSSIGFKPQG